jgi:hypothetical protein
MAVVFPAPFGPSRATTSPDRTVRSTPNNPVVALYAFVRFEAETSGSDRYKRSCIGRACTVVLLMAGPSMVARPCSGGSGVVSSLDLGGTGGVTRVVLRPDGRGIGVLRDARNAVGEVVEELHDHGVRPFRLGIPLRLGWLCAWRRRFEVSTGD